ncbi:hypothetical protein [Streptodolium elevatio]|uniref:Uncharacterized protein n=1 Tax=Streptodolium elevatio TaxID=3157996 RepID=A0ABV3DWP1_9ACTN
MGLHEKYRCYYQGSKEALSLLERDRRGIPLAKLLATRARTALDMRSSINYADDSRDFADGYAALAGIVADYARLCGELHADVTQAGRPEPPWRVVERGRFAVRAPSTVRRPASATLVRA